MRGTSLSHAHTSLTADKDNFNFYLVQFLFKLQEENAHIETCGTNQSSSFISETTAGI
jgi:hypothetical protein